VQFRLFPHIASVHFWFNHCYLCILYNYLSHPRFYYYCLNIYLCDSHLHSIFLCHCCLHPHCHNFFHCCYLFPYPLLTHILLVPYLLYDYYLLTNHSHTHTHFLTHISFPFAFHFTNWLTRSL